MKFILLYPLMDDNNLLCLLMDDNDFTIPLDG